MDYSKVKFVKPSVGANTLQKGKVYKFTQKQGDGGYVTDDRRILIFIRIGRCAHLGFKNWIPCDENGKELGDE